MSRRDDMLAGDYAAALDEADRDYHDEAPDLRRDARAEMLSELSPEERGTIRRKRRAWTPARRRGFAPLPSSEDDGDRPF